jgi:ArsR family transcriptional regulator
MHSVSVNPTELFQALSDQTRLRIVRLLSTFPEEDVCLCELSESVLEPEYNISRHVKILRQVGLLSFFKEGRWVYHRLVTDSPLLKDLCNLVASLPDNGSLFKGDAGRLKKQIKMREKPRCVRDGAAETKAGSASGKNTAKKKRIN